MRVGLDLRRQVLHAMATDADGQAALNAIRKASASFARAARVSLAPKIWTFRRNSWPKWEPRPAALPGP